MNEIVQSRHARKMQWQRNQRAQFVIDHGYSSNINYATGGLRQDVLVRDDFRCVECGMTDVEHKAKWNRPITIDHKDKDRSHNTMENLQTMCLTCHGRKDITPRLIAQKVPAHKETIIAWRASGLTYQQIADQLKFSIASIWKWCKRWEAA